MPDNPKLIYWDACVFLSYINDIPSRITVLEPLLADSAKENGTVAIYTSTISQVETSFAAAEQQQKALAPETEQRIDNLWADTNAIISVEYHNVIGREARQLMRDGIPQGWSLKPLDAIHLATAKWLCSVGIPIAEFHTYDTRLYRYADAIGVKIIEPYVIQQQLL